MPLLAPSPPTMACSIVGGVGSSISLAQLSFDVEHVFHKVLEHP